MYYAESNKAILQDMKESGALFASEEMVHSYPHCWRCKSPIIFRATPQWFCSVESFKDRAIAACNQVQWFLLGAKTGWWRCFGSGRIGVFPGSAAGDADSRILLQALRKTCLHEQDGGSHFEALR